MTSSGSLLVAVLEFVGAVLLVLVSFIAVNKLFDRAMPAASVRPESASSGDVQDTSEAVRVARARLDSGEISQNEFDEIRQTLND